MHQKRHQPLILPNEPPLRSLFICLHEHPGATLAVLIEANPETPLWALKWRLLQLELSGWIEVEEGEYWAKRWG